MTSLKNQTTRTFLVCILLLLLPGSIHAWEPNTTDLDAAINSGDFGEYSTKIPAWLNTKVPANPSGISEATLKTLLNDPVFANTLAQRQLISKIGADNMAAFARGDQKNKSCLAWLLRNTEAMELYIKGATPVGIGQRDANHWKIGVSSTRRSPPARTRN